MKLENVNLETGGVKFTDGYSMAIGHVIDAFIFSEGNPDIFEAYLKRKQDIAINENKIAAK